MKVRGFTLCHRASEKINFDTMKEMVLHNPDDKITTHNPDQIFRDKLNFKIFSKPMDKVYKLTNNKRVYLEDHTSRPFGYSRSSAPDLKVDKNLNVILPHTPVLKYKYLGKPCFGHDDMNYE